MSYVNSPGGVSPPTLAIDPKLNSTQTSVGIKDVLAIVGPEVKNEKDIFKKYHMKLKGLNQTVFSAQQDP